MLNHDQLFLYEEARQKTTETDEIASSRIGGATLQDQECGGRWSLSCYLYVSVSRIIISSACLELSVQLDSL